MIISEKNKSENARAYALRVLNYNIRVLELTPGQQLSENEISSQLGLSRTPVREALLELSKFGLIDIIPQKGSYVSRIDYNAIEEARFMREVLENAILKILCSEISDEYLEKLKSNVTLQKVCIKRYESDDKKRLFELDDEFHRLLFEASEKMHTYNVIKSQMKNFDRLRTLTIKSIKQDRIVDDHENILYALERHDYELAEMLMSRHLCRCKADFKQLIEIYPDYFV